MDYGWTRATSPDTDPLSDLDLWMRLQAARVEMALEERVQRIEHVRREVRSPLSEDGASERRVTWYVTTAGTGHGCAPRSVESLPPPNAARKGWA